MSDLWSRLVSLLSVFFILASLAAPSALYSREKVLFKEVQSVELQLKDELFTSLSQVTPAGNEFLVILNKSRLGQQHYIIKLDASGKVIAKYDRQGDGPGEFSALGGIIQEGDFFLCSELIRPVIHKFDRDLKFIEDFRIERGGVIVDLGNRIGIWSDVIKDGKNYMLTLCDRKSFAKIKHAFEVAEIPNFVRTEGGLCRISENLYAGVYVNEYQIRLFDGDFNLKNRLIKERPPYIKEYARSNGSPHNLDLDGYKWLDSWTKVGDIFFINNHLLIVHQLKLDDSRIDIHATNGGLVVSNYRLADDEWLNYSDGKYLWMLKTVNPDTDDRRYYYIKKTLELR